MSKRVTYAIVENKIKVMGVFFDGEKAIEKMARIEECPWFNKDKS
ncbi:hypothetical protein [Vagococcus fluvialis]|nr:hypothetical protein [Vagococcus fluvialis]